MARLEVLCPCALVTVGGEQEGIGLLRHRDLRELDGTSLDLHAHELAAAQETLALRRRQLLAKPLGHRETLALKLVVEPPPLLGREPDMESSVFAMPVDRPARTGLGQTRGVGAHMWAPTVYAVHGTVTSSPSWP